MSEFQVVAKIVAKNFRGYMYSLLNTVNYTLKPTPTV